MKPKSDEQFELIDPGWQQSAVATGQIRAPEPSPEGRIRSGRLAGLSMWQAIFVLSWPILVESFLQSLVGLVDTALAAGISEAATDAIGAAAYFLWLFNLVGMALGVGATAIISRSVAKGRLAVAGAAVGQATLASLAAGIIVAVIIWLIAPLIASWLNLDGVAATGAIQYLRISAFGVPAFTFLAIGIASCRGAGDAMKPLMTMVAVNAINIVSSFILSGVDIARTTVGPGGELQTNILLENPFGFDKGIVGIAYGTLIAWLSSAVIMSLILLRGTHGVRLRPGRLRPHWHTMRRLVRVGMPNYFETLGMWLGNYLILLMVGWMNIPGMLGAHVVAVRIEAFSFLPGFAMGMAAATLAGQYLGAGSPRLARLAVLRCTGVAVGIMFLFGLAFLTVPRQIVGLFSRQELHMEVTPQLLLVCGFIQVPFALAITIRAALRGAGDTRVAMMITWLSTYAVRLPLAWLFSGLDLPLPGGGVLANPAPLRAIGIDEPLVGLWIGLCTEIVIRCLAFVARFLHGGWTRIRV